MKRLGFVSGMLVTLALAACGKPRVNSTAEDTPTSPELAASTASTRAVPRRAYPIPITNRVSQSTSIAVTAVATNSPPSITCGPAQTFPCSSADGVQATIAVHIEDLDGDALTVIWNADGKDRYTQQVALSENTTSANLTFSYTFTPGDHGVKVTVSDGSLSASCESSVTVQKDTEEPVIHCPKNLVTWPDPGRCFAVVTFNPTVIDNCPDVSFACDPPSGSAFPLGTTPVQCTATDSAGNTATCTFEVTVQFANMCPKSDVFWKQNMGIWPVSSITLGNQVYNRSQLSSLIRSTVQSDASLILSRQLIAASLNTANRSDPRPVCAILNQAHDLLRGFSGKLPFRVNVSSPIGQSMMGVATTLNAYNNGMFTPDCVP